MSDTNVNTEIANSGKTLPRYITLPFRDFGEVPANSPQWFLRGFAGWVDSQCSDALLDLRRLNFRAHEINSSAIHAARRGGIESETSFSETSFSEASLVALLPALLFGLGSLPSGEAEKLSEFFFFYLERARHEITLVALDFFHEMALDYIPAHHFDGDRQDQFEARFAEYLDDRDYGSFKNEAWKTSGLSVDDLIAALLDAAIVNTDAPEAEETAPRRYVAVCEDGAEIPLTKEQFLDNFHEQGEPLKVQLGRADIAFVTTKPGEAPGLDDGISELEAV